MTELYFEWDSNKAKSNFDKHGITFEEAKSVFLDEDALIIYDPDALPVEDRFLILGFSSQAKMLVVCHCYRDDERTIRIISARKATASEARNYERRPV